jgi:hypothetical protein
MKRHLFYTFLIVFGLTAVITILGILNVVTIGEFYLKGLFSALLIELVGAVVGIYRKTDFFNQTDSAMRDRDDENAQRVSMSNTSGIPDPAAYGVTITQPEPNKAITVIDVRGTIRKSPPPGYSLWVFRIYPNDHFIPLRKAWINTQTNTWEALACDIGGKTGDARRLAAYLVGPAGAVLLDYYYKAVGVHNPIRDELSKLTGKDQAWLPLMSVRTPDMVDCVRVPVKRA